MPDYSIIFARSARKELEAIDPPFARTILRHIEALAITPRPHSCVKLMGEEDLWRIRIGDYRVVYRILDDRRVIDIVRVRHRREVYR